MTHPTDSQTIRDTFTVANGIRLHYVESGHGPLVVLLHGFPDFWYVWRRQIPVLAAAGRRVVAPDLRGYNLSDKPHGPRHYTIDALVADIAALIDRLGERSATVVGHDWGGILAWHLAAAHPDRVHRLAILNAPHPAALRRALRMPTQLLRSSYAFFFQLPWLPERVLSAFDHAVVIQALRAETTRPDAFTERDRAAYRAALGQPGALTAMLNYYRAAPRALRRSAPALRRPIAAPTLVIWGARDPHLDRRLLDGLDRRAPRLRVEVIRDAGHWVQLDAAERVNTLLLAFAGPRAAARPTAGDRYAE